MKRHIFALTGGLLSSMLSFGQQAPTNNSPAGAILNGETSNQFWSRAGNTNAFGSNNIFGTRWNSPIYTQTAGANRMKLNGQFTAVFPSTQYPINGYTAFNGVNTSGYLLLGINKNNSSGESVYSVKGAYSLLHLNGEGTVIQELGYRPWMQTGITLTGNNDLSYFGLRQIGTVNDRTETVIGWSDNGGGSIGDELVFRFTGTSSGNTALSTDFASPDDIDGLHVGRFSPAGRFGLGNTFGHIDDPQSVLYNTPQSLFHMSYQFRAGDAFEPYGFLQISYRTAVGGSTIIGQGETANDGLRLGIDNQALIGGPGASLYLNSFLRWQERSSFIIQTESETDNNVQNDERMRVTSIGALNANYGSNYFGNIGPGNDNRTRIGISAAGQLPVTRPMSLLHLGFDAPNPSGWRTWMDIGSFMSNGLDNMYVGMMRISNDAANDRFDAVINWGDNFDASGGTNTGPDNLRFMFTSNGVGGGTAGTAAAGAVGLEGGRMTPSQNGILTGFGGTAGANPYYGGGENATATLEVNGWGTASNVNGGNSGLRFTNLNTTSLPIANPGDGVLTVDGEGDVVYTFGPGGAGAPCSTIDPLAGALFANHRMNLNNNNYYFLNLQPSSLVNPTFNKVAVGYTCGNPLPGKLNVMQDELFNVSFNTMASHAQNLDVGTQNGLSYIGVRGLTNGLQTYRINNYGGYFTGSDAELNYGVRGIAFRGANTNYGSFNFGGYFTADGPKDTYGVYTVATNPGTTGFAYGIYASANGGNSTITRAGFFDGLISVAGVTYPSDSALKINVIKLTNTLGLIQKLKPVSYDYDAAGYPQMNFDDHKQFGYIAQEVEQIFPNLVYDGYQPVKIDSLGNPIDSAVNFKGLNYTGFIALNTQAIIELNQKVEKATLSDESIKTNVQDLTGSLDKVLDMRGVSYDWIHTIHPELNLDSVNHVGFIAQEIQQIDPRLTYVADDSLLHVEYDKVVSILAEAIQELNTEVESKDSIIEVLISENETQQSTIDSQQGTIDDLNTRLTNLENCLSALLPTLCSMNHSLVQNNTPSQQEEVRKNLSVVLNNRSAIILDQNVPNPFAEQTVINFSIPATVVKAQIHFYDVMGKLIQSVDVNDRGLGSLTVFGSDLSTGVYTYTLVADGQIVATKKMMKQ